MILTSTEAHLFDQYFTLPVQFHSRESGTDNTAGDELSRNGGGGGGGRGRNGKRKRDDEDRKVRNKAQFDQFKLRANENYKIFTGQDNARTRPNFNSKCKMCNKWNIHGYCISPIARTRTAMYLIPNTPMNRRLPLEIGWQFAIKLHPRPLATEGSGRGLAMPGHPLLQSLQILPLSANHKGSLIPSFQVTQAKEDEVDCSANCQQGAKVSSTRTKRAAALRQGGLLS
jgi:hypothetical protein